MSCKKCQNNNTKKTDNIALTTALKAKNSASTTPIIDRGRRMPIANKNTVLGHMADRKPR